MPNDWNHISVSSESLRRKHEARDPHLRNALIIIAGVAFMVVFCLAATGILIGIFSKQRAMQKMQIYGVIAAPDVKPLSQFPEPNLQIDDGHAQMTALIIAQNQKLNTYGWIDRSNGIVHIPIGRAMDGLLAHPLPTRTNGVSSTSASPLQLLQERPAQR
jgi:hypothetical protein